MVDLVGSFAAELHMVLAVRTAVVEERRTAAAELHMVVGEMVRYTVPALDLQELHTVAAELRKVAEIRTELVVELHTGLGEDLVVHRTVTGERHRVVVVMVRHIVLEVVRRTAVVAVHRVVAGRTAAAEEHHTVAEEGTGLLVVRHVAVGNKTL